MRNALGQTHQNAKDSTLCTVLLAFNQASGGVEKY